MRKISFWLMTLANIVMLVLAIVGIVKVSKEYGFDIEQYMAYQRENIWDSVGFWITIGMAGIAIILLVVDYYIEGDRLKRILMSIALALPIVLGGVISILSIFMGTNVLMIPALIWLASCLWPIIMMLISEHHRAKFIYLILSLIWLFAGIFLFVAIFALIVLAIVIGIGLLFLGGGERYKEVYDQSGRFLYRIYED